MINSSCFIREGSKGGVRGNEEGKMLRGKKLKRRGEEIKARGSGTKQEGKGEEIRGEWH